MFRALFRQPMGRLAIAMLSLVPAGCASTPAGDPDAQIVAATLALLGKDRAPTLPPLCVDSRTRGEPLAIFRTMRPAPNGNRRFWREAAPLQPGPNLSGRVLFEDAIGRGRARIADPNVAKTPLPLETQRRLDASARTLAVLGDSNNVTMTQDFAPATVAPRWWVRNRIDRSCERIYVLSRVTRDATTGFVTVSADHWATTYAAERQGDGWRIAAQWDTWLY